MTMPIDPQELFTAQADRQVLHLPLAELVAPVAGWWQPRRAGLSIQLANMERSHKARLEDIYTNMAFPETW